MSHTKAALKNSYKVFVLTAVAILVGYLLRIYLSRALSIEDFGLFYAVTAFVALFVTLQDFGAGISLAKFISEFAVKKLYTQIKSSILIVLVIQLVILLICNAAVFIFADAISLMFFKTIEASIVLKLLMLSLLFSSVFRIFQFTFQGFQRMKLFAIVEPVRISLAFVLSVLLIYMGIIGVAYAYFLAAVITTVVFFLPFLKMFDGFFKIEANMTKKLTKKLMLFATPVFIGTVASFAILYIDTIMISFFMTLRDVGLYQVAIPTSQFLWVFVTTISMVLFPMITELYTKKKTELVGTNISIFANISFFVTIPFAVILMAFPEIIVSFLFGHDYIGSVAALRILVVGSLFYSIFYLFQNSLMAIGKPTISTRIIIEIAVFNFILNLLFIPMFGIIGAAVTSTLSYFLASLISYRYLKKFVTFKISFGRLARILLSAIITVLVLLFVKGLLVMDNQILEAVLSLVPSFAVYIVLIFATKSVTRRDLEYFRKLGLRLPRWLG